MRAHHCQGECLQYYLDVTVICITKYIKTAGCKSVQWLKFIVARISTPSSQVMLCLCPSPLPVFCQIACLFPPVSQHLCQRCRASISLWETHEHGITSRLYPATIFHLEHLALCTKAHFSFTFTSPALPLASAQFCSHAGEIHLCLIAQFCPAIWAFFYCSFIPF